MSLSPKSLAVLFFAGAIVAFAIGQWPTGLWLLGAMGLAALWQAERTKTQQRVMGFVDMAKKVRSGTFHSHLVPRQTSPPWSQLSAVMLAMGNETAEREANLLDDSASLQAVLTSMTEGVLAIDADGNLMMANRSASQMLAITQPEVIGRPLINHIRIPELMAAIEKSQQQLTRVECEFQTLGEPRRTISARLSSINADSETSSIAIVLHDVTSIRQLENMRRDFVANISHELKTPLSVIKAYAETLKMGAINDQARNVEFVDLIESQANLLERQIQDLIQLARIESQNANFEIAQLDLNAICRECVSELMTVAEKRKIHLTHELSDAVLTVEGDAEAYRAILKNLITNALQFTPAQGRITVRSKAKGDKIQIEVIDTGIGIAPDQLTRIFERFYRADKARSREMGGTGLGLAIVKHLVTSMEGTVAVESKVGKGSTFRIIVPSS